MARVAINAPHPGIIHVVVNLCVCVSYTFNCVFVLRTLSLKVMKVYSTLQNV